MTEIRLVTHPYGFRYVEPTPSQDEIDAYYADEFYSEQYAQMNDSGLGVQEADREFFNGARSDVLADIERFLGRPAAGLSLLDVGCGWGEALLFFRDAGLTVAGFDPAPEAVARARELELDVQVAGVERLDVFGGRRFDIVTLFNVLEHLADPVAVVKEARQTLLQPGGLLIIDVPNDFNEWQQVGRAVHDLDEWWVAPPAHLNYFTPTSLRAMLEGEGYEVRGLRASFPLEMFLLMGDRYVGDPSLGRRCHERRVAFERSLRRHGGEASLRRFYEALADIDLGRQVVAIAQVPV